MTDIAFRLQALIPATQDMDSTDAAETIEEACCEIFELRGMVTEARRERDEAIKTRNGQLDYSIDLQRIIEALRVGKEIPMPKSGARHHYAMALEIRRERDEARAALAPFARFGELLGPPDPEGFDILLYQPAGAPEIKICGNDCRRATAALKDRAP
jgi:hypothetical protein